MSLDILLSRTEAGLDNGALYALVAITLVFVFRTTRVVFVPLGAFISYGALTLVSFETYAFACVLALGLASGLRRGWVDRKAMNRRSLMLLLCSHALAPAIFLICARFASSAAARPLVVAPLIVAMYGLAGLYLYDLVFRPIMNRSAPTLFIVSAAAHALIVCVAFAIFGPEGARSPIEWGDGFQLGALHVAGASVAIYLSAAVIIFMLYIFVTRTASCDASKAGRLSFGLASSIGALIGVMISSNTTIFYDTGLLVGLKGSVAAFVGGWAGYPAAIASALLTGLLESCASLYAGISHDVAIPALVVPTLLYGGFTKTQSRLRARSKRTIAR
ncbi:MAG: hypothetical protein KGL46_00285 [Hyphomicrobiales bacterium]|nr:hypothetical protein [Hyphomicrobiales bacterium]